MSYVCPECGKNSKLPDFCCGRSMVRLGSFVCRECGASSQQAAECCGQTMVQV